MDRLVLTLLGGFGARLESGRHLPLRTKKGQALLAYLACHPTGSHPRDKLATLFWGDMPQSCARHSLRQTLFVLRAALPGSVSAALRCDSDNISLDPISFVVDVVEFERLARDSTTPSLEQAGGLYHGDLLDGIAAGEQAFEEWLRGERERLHNLAVDVFAKLLALQREAGLTENAIQSGLRLLRLDPLHEVVYRTLMRLYLSLGRPGAALRQYQMCAQTLRRELGFDPSVETQQLLHEIVPPRLRRVLWVRRSPGAHAVGKTPGPGTRINGLDFDAPSDTSLTLATQESPQVRCRHARQASLRNGTG